MRQLKLLAWWFAMGVLTAADAPAEWAFYPARALGAVDVSRLPECSGLAASRRYPGRLYAINDHGNPPFVHALDTLGQYIAAFTRPGLILQDCEEVALLPAARPDQPDSLLVADIGDNRYADHAIRPFARLYRLPEPEWMLGPTAGPLDSLRFTYADGPRDCEALLPDALTGEILLISKRDQPSRVYTLRPVWGGGARTLVAQRSHELPLTWVVAASVRPDRSAVLIRSIRRVLLYPVRPGEPIREALRRPPLEFDAPPDAIEHQGESIAWAADGQSYYSLSEVSDRNPHPRLVRTERRR